MTGVLTFVFALQMTCFNSWLVHNLYECPTADVCSRLALGLASLRHQGIWSELPDGLLNSFRISLSAKPVHTCVTFKKPIIWHSHQLQIGLDQLCEGQVSISTSIFSSFTHLFFCNAFTLPWNLWFLSFGEYNVNPTEGTGGMRYKNKSHVLIKWSSQKNWQMKSDLFDHTVSQGSECPNPLEIINNISNEAQSGWSLA